VSVSDNRRHRAYPALTNDFMVVEDRSIRGAGFGVDSSKINLWRSGWFVTRSDNRPAISNQNRSWHAHCQTNRLNDFLLKPMW